MSRQTTVICLSVALAVSLFVFGLSVRGAYKAMFTQEPEIVVIEVDESESRSGKSAAAEPTAEPDEYNERFGATAVEIKIVGEEARSGVDRSRPYDKSGLEPVYNIEGIDVLTAQILNGVTGIGSVHDDTEKAQSALKITNLMDKEMARAFIKDTITLYDGELWRIAYGAFDDTAYEDRGEIDWMLTVVPETSFNDSQVIVFTLSSEGIVNYEVY